MSQTDLSHLWQEHAHHEFVTRDTEATLATMVEDAYVNQVPVMTGGFGKSALRILFAKLHPKDAAGYHAHPRISHDRREPAC